MWPKNVDVEPEECAGILRRLELEAFSGVVTALRAQGDLSKERRKVLSDLSGILNISPERHKTEIRRALNDELLSTVAKSVSGPNCENEWAREGRRIIPLLRRATPITAFTPPADVVKHEVESWNRTLNAPLNTRTPRRKVLAHEQQRGLMPPPPPPLSEIMNENGEVRPPTVSMPARSRNSNSHNNNAMGDVVVLPSGMVIRVKHEEPTPESREAKGRRKRKNANAAAADAAAASAAENSCGSYEILPPGLFFPPPSSSAPFFPHLAHPYFASPSFQTPPSGGGKRRRGSKYSQAFNPTMLTQSGHGYARPFLPQVPSPLSELEKMPSSSFAQPMIMPGSNSKVMFVTASNQSSSSPPSAMSMPQLPKNPVLLSPQKFNHQGATTTPQQRPAVKSRAKQPQAGAAAKQPQTYPPPSSSPQGQDQQQQQPSSGATSPATGNKLILNSPRLALGSPRAPNSSVVVATGGAQLVTAVSRNATTATIQLKDGTLAQGMRVFPAGARILPKPGGAGGSTTVVTSSCGTILTAPPAGTPVYMVTTSGGQNVMRVARAAVPTSSTATGILGQQQRVVTVSSAALKAAQPTLSLRTAAPGTIVRTLQPQRALLPPGATATTGTLVRPAGGGVAPNRPSVIVVQRTPKSSMGGLIPAGAAIAGQRILQTKDGKPVVIVSKPGMHVMTASSAGAAGSSSTGSGGGGGGHPISVSLSKTAYTTTTMVTTNAKATEGAKAQGGNVIVLDLSQEQQGTRSSNVLSDILQATGIYSKGSSAANHANDGGEENEAADGGNVQNANFNAQGEDERNGDGDEVNHVDNCSNDRTEDSAVEQMDTDTETYPKERERTVKSKLNHTALKVPAKASANDSKKRNNNGGETIEDVSAFIASSSSSGEDRTDESVGNSSSKAKGGSYVHEEIVEVAAAMAAMADGAVVIAEGKDKESA